MARPKGLTREQILDAPDSKLEPVEVPEWPDASGDPGIVYIRTISGTERDQYEQGTMQLRGNTVIPKLERARTKLIVLTACDEDGNRLFTTDDIRDLAKKSARPLERIFDKARDLNGFTNQDLEELVGNSDGSRSGDSSTD